MASGQLRAVMRQLRRVVAPISSGLSDAQLLERFLATRDEAAFELLVRRHEQMVLGVLRRLLHDSHFVENAFQATFLAFARKATGIVKGSSVGAWLYQVAYRVGLRARANASRQARREPSMEHLPESWTAEGPEQEAAWREVRLILDDELNRLPEKYRTPLVLCYLEGLSYRAAAIELGSSVGTVSTRLTRGRELLRSRLARRGVELSACVLGAFLAQTSASAAAAAGLIDATIKSALVFAANPAAVAASTEILTLAQGVLRTMFLAKLKTAAAVVLSVTCAGMVAGTLVHQSTAAQPPSDGGTGGQSVSAPVAQAPVEGWREAATIQVRGRSGPGAVASLAVSPDGKLLSAGTDDRAVKVWAIVTGTEASIQIVEVGEIATGNEARIQIRAMHDGPVLSVRFSPDGKTLASGSEDGTVRFWEVDSPTGADPAVHGSRSAVRHTGAVTSVAFSPDGKVVASGGADNTVRLWDVPSKRERSRSTSNDRVTSLAFSPDGKLLVSAGDDGTVRLWDAATGKEVRRDAQHQVRVFVLSPDGRLVISTDNDENLRFWEVATGKEVRRARLGHGPRTLAISPDGKLVAAGGSGVVVILDVATGKVIVELKGHKATVQSVTFTPDGRRLITGDKGGVIRIWDTLPAAGRQAVASGAGVAKTEKDRLDELVRQLALSQRPAQQIVEALYLATLARFPTELEAKHAGDHLARKKDRLEAIQDLVFALTSTKEFVTHLEALNKRNPWRQLRDPRTP